MSWHRTLAQDPGIGLWHRAPVAVRPQAVKLALETSLQNGGRTGSVSPRERSHGLFSFPLTLKSGAIDRQTLDK